MPNFEGRLSVPANLRAVSFRNEGNGVTVTFNKGADQGAVTASCFINQNGELQQTQVSAPTRERALYRIGVREDIKLLRRQFNPGEQNDPKYVVVGGEIVEEVFERDRGLFPGTRAKFPSGGEIKVWNPDIGVD